MTPSCGQSGTVLANCNDTNDLLNSMSALSILAHTCCDELLAYAMTLESAGSATTLPFNRLENAEMDKLFDELAQLLSEHNMRAMKVLHVLKASIGPSLDEQMQQIEQALDMFDFRLATARVRDLRSGLS